MTMVSQNGRCQVLSPSPSDGMPEPTNCTAVPEVHIGQHIRTRSVSMPGSGAISGLYISPEWSASQAVMNHWIASCAGSAVRLNRSLNADSGPIYRKALRRTVQWVRSCSTATAATVSHQQLLATAAIQPPRKPLSSHGEGSGNFFDGPLGMLSAPLRLLAAAACAVRGAPSDFGGSHFTVAPPEVRCSPASPLAAHRPELYPLRG